MRAEASGPAALVREVGVPALFVVLWSTGFIGAKLGLPHAPPLTFLAVRFWLAAALLALLALATRAPWPLFGETLGPVALLGMALTVAGVAMATRR